MGKRKAVVVVGASFAGFKVASLLTEHKAILDVTLIDGKGYFEYYPSTLRCLVEPSRSAKTLAVLKPESCVHDCVAEVTEHEDELEVVTKRGSRYRCDFLVLASGSTYPSPVKESLPFTQSPGCSSLARRRGEDQDVPLQRLPLEARRSEFEEWHKRILEASHIAVVGGGPVGVELCAELLGAFPSKQVTLVTSADRLLPQLDERCSQYCMAWLTQKHKATVILGEKVDVKSQGQCYVAFDSAGCKLFEANLIFQCHGQRVSKTLKTPFEATAAGIQHLDTMQVIGRPNVYVCGDAAASPAPKTAFVATLQASVVASNILSRARGKEDLRCTFPASVCHGLAKVPTVFNISLYKHDGVMQAGKLVLRGRLAALSKQMLEDFYWKIVRGSTVFERLLSASESATILMVKLFYRE